MVAQDDEGYKMGMTQKEIIILLNRLYCKKYYYKNRDKMTVKAKLYRNTHKEYWKKWRSEHPVDKERQATYNRMYYQLYRKVGIKKPRREYNV